MPIPAGDTASIIALVAMLMLWPSAASGYQCKAPREFEEEAAQARAIFEGRIVRIDKTAEGYQAVFVVERPWKGAAPGQELPVFSKTLGDFYGTCTDALKLNERYLVYAHGRPGALAFEPCGRGVGRGECDRTQMLGDPEAEEDLRALAVRFGAPSGDAGTPVAP